LKNLNKFFALIENKQIFELIQKSFELNYDEITFSEEKLIIKLMINMMNVLTEEIDFEIPGIKMEKQDEIVILRESVDIMEKERSNFKKEINLLNNTVEELQKKIEEKDIMQQNMIKELKNVIEINKKESKKEIEEEKSAQQNIIKDFKNIVETNKKEFQNKINEILDERKKKEKELLNLIEKQKEEITKLKKTEEYVKENLICQENKEKEKDKCSFIIKLNPIEDSNFKIEINILLFENKIKFIINEIQDELQSNPLIYENYFTLEDFTKDKEDIILRGIGNLKDIFIYIKEHPAQTCIGRSENFYERFANRKRVKFIRTDVNSRILCDNSMAVVTCTGTIGWEALIRCKPVLMFGSFFYQFAPGCFCVKTREQLLTSIKTILSDYKIIQNLVKFDIF